MNANLISRALAKAISHLLAFVLASALSASLVQAAPQGTLPVLTTAPLPAHVPTASAPAGQGVWAPLLEQAVPNNPALLSSVISLMNDGRAAKNPGAARNPALMVVSYRNDPSGVRDVVVQLFNDPGTELTGVLNPQGTVRNRVGDDLFSSADGFLGLIYRQVSYLGQQAEVQRQQRAMTSALSGDLTLLREQTVEPLRVVAVLPEAGQFLPGSLRSRVRSVVVNAELTFGEWRGKIGMITDDERSAEAVGNIVAAWREMAVSLADTFASTAVAQPLRAALKETSIEVSDNQVLASATIPAAMVVRVSTELAGHGGGCAPGGVCGKNKVAMCHKEPGKPNQTLCVTSTSVSSHLAHGDTCGPCSTP
jgi:hypothetical protein